MLSNKTILQTVFSHGILMATVLLLGSNSFANYAFTPSVAFAPSQNAEQGADVKSSASSFDFRLGYVFDFGMYVGGLYSLSDERPAESAVGSSSYVVGPTVGYTRWNAFAFLTYIIHGERDLNSGGIKYGSAEGINADIGYVFDITKSFSLGPQLSYKKVAYRDYQFNEIDEPAPDSKWEIVTPAIVAWFRF